MIAEELTALYKRVTDDGINPQLLARFSIVVGSAYSGAVANGGNNTVDFMCDDDSMIIIEITAGQSPKFTIVEKVHGEMGEVAVARLERVEK